MSTNAPPDGGDEGGRLGRRRSRGRHQSNAGSMLAVQQQNIGGSSRQGDLGVREVAPDLTNISL